MEERVGVVVVLAKGKGKGEEESRFRGWCLRDGWVWV